MAIVFLIALLLLMSVGGCASHYVTEEQRYCLDAAEWAKVMAVAGDTGPQQQYYANLCKGSSYGR